MAPLASSTAKAMTHRNPSSSSFPAMECSSSRRAARGDPDGVGREIFKDPITDNGVKKSARGRLCVTLIDGIYCLVDRQDSMDPANCCLREVFRDGKLLVDDTIAAIRERVKTGNAA